ncbi:MAG: tetratricopeptide repeat protein [Chitinophagaceae bacterium]|nr:tetratricopeptide repeat protein [Chitinophagaceae bacterium]
MRKLIPGYLALLITIISCNNQDHAKQNGEIAGGPAAMREKILTDSILQFPDSLILKEKLIQFYRDSADFDKAIETTDKAILTDSLNYRLWEIKATLHYENYDTALAISSYETALLLNPLPRYIILLGSLYAQTKNNKANEMADFLLTTKIPNTEKEAFFIKGLYYNYTGEKNKAIGFFDKCLNLDPGYMLAYREKGIALYDQGKYNDAITVLDKAVTLRNNFDEGYYWLGRCLEKLNKPKDAIEEYKTALMYSPDYIEAEDALKRLNAR